MKGYGRGAGLMLLGALAALAACSKGPADAPPAAAQAAMAAEAQADKELAIYRQLMGEKSYELAAPIGHGIVSRFGQSLAAREVKETLADTEAKASAIATRRRLERLWSYQSGKESGGEQNTASLYSSDVAAGDRVRLILRRHSAWGQSVYLFGDGKGFECRGNCTLAVHIDEQPVKRLKAYLPETGEPALFIADDKAFISLLAHAQKIGMDVLEKGKQPRTLVFETGGFDATKFPALAKKR